MVREEVGFKGTDIASTIELRVASIALLGGVRERAKSILL